MFDIAGTVELGTICPGTGTWNRLQDGMFTRFLKACPVDINLKPASAVFNISELKSIAKAFRFCYETIPFSLVDYIDRPAHCLQALVS